MAEMLSGVVSDVGEGARSINPPESSLQMPYLCIGFRDWCGEVMYSRAFLLSVAKRHRVRICAMIGSDDGFLTEDSADGVISCDEYIFRSDVVVSFRSQIHCNGHVLFFQT